jgi:hypothetical protein
MKQNEQIDSLTMSIDSLVDRYIAEFDLPIATIIGVLEEKKVELVLGGGVHFESDMDQSEPDELTDSTDDDLLI